MVFIRKQTTFKPTNRIIPGTSFLSFTGIYHYENINLLDVPKGSLLQNTNMEYVYSVSKNYLKTIRGSNLIKDITNEAISSYSFHVGDEKFLVWIDSLGNLKTYDFNTETISTSKSGLSLLTHDLTEYRLLNNESFYGGSADGIYKLDNLLTYSLIFNQPVKSIAYDDKSGRMWWAYGHKAGYSNIQQKDAIDTSNLETFNALNFITIDPTKGKEIHKVVSFNEYVFFFKDTMVSRLINSSEDIDQWYVVECTIPTGSKSIHTIKTVNNLFYKGIFALCSDKKLRYIDANGIGYIISNTFQSILNKIDEANLEKCIGYFQGNYYILVIPVEDNILNTTIMIDITKFMSRRGSDEIEQPFWFINKEVYAGFATLNASELYGFHKDGYIQRILIDNYFLNDCPNRIEPDEEYKDYITVASLSGTFTPKETITGLTSGVTMTLEEDLTSEIIGVSSGEWIVGETIEGSTSSVTAQVESVVRKKAIEWDAYTAWSKESDNELMLYDLYMNWQVLGKWSIYMSLNSFLLGEPIPLHTAGLNFEINPQDIQGAYFDIDFFDQAYFDSASSGQLSQNLGKSIKGHYFLYGWYNKVWNGHASIFGFEPRFKLEKRNPMGRNA
jgi:hypothetical protein